MGRKYSALKQENEELRQALAGFVAKHHIEAGDLVVFLAERNPDPTQRATRYQRSTIGLSFGTGYGCMENIRRLLCELAGGVVGVMASSSEAINVYNLNRDERARLRATIDAIDKGQAKPTFKPLVKPLGPLGSDPSINTGPGPVSLTEGKQPMGTATNILGRAGIKL